MTFRARRALDEGERGVGDFAPSVVDGQGVASAFDLDDLGDTRVALLPLVRRVGDGLGDCVVEVAGGDQQRDAVEDGSPAPGTANSS